MKEYIVTGMSCAACSVRVEKEVKKLENVKECSVNLLTNTMKVSGDFSDEEILYAVEKAGYGIKFKDTPKKEENIESKNNIIPSILILLVLMYISMGYTMFSFPLPRYLDKNPLSVAIIQMLLSLIIMIINKKFFINGYKGIVNKSPNMDSLVSLGSFASFIYSVAVVFYMTNLYVEGNVNLASHQLHELYFESAAMILVLITFGKMLESKSKKKTTDAINSLIKLAPKTAIVIREGKETKIDAKDILVGDIFIVKPGGIIPADGIVIDGSASVNESMLTGESIPVDKEKGDSVSQSTYNESGYLKCEAKKTGEDTLFFKIIKRVTEASNSKPPIAKVADKVSGIFVPIVILISVITFTIWYILNKDIGFSLARAISVLVISCPCALGLATPVAVMVGNGVGAKHGILFKNAQALEYTGKIKTVALDKTGTITKGKPEVTDIIPFNITDNELLSYAYSLEIKSEHPLAKAIIKKGQDYGITPLLTSDFKIHPGNGLKAVINSSIIRGGNAKYISQFTSLNNEILEITDKLSISGKTPLFFTKDNEFLGVIAVMDTVKDESISAIEELRNMGIKTIILTGDNLKTAQAIKNIVNADDVISDVLPDEKAQIIKKLMSKSKTAMVGDGINDAPALATADVGIAVGQGTDVAINTSDVVLIDSSLKNIPKLIKLSRKTLKTIYENLFWAFIYNIIGIPLAAGVFIPLYGLKLTPMFGAFAMSISSLFVVTNALRINNIKFNNKEKKIMEVTMKIEGMMCKHCEARVKKVLEELSAVSEAIVSHENSSAIVKMTEEIPFNKLKETVEAQGYKVID